MLRRLLVALSLCLVSIFAFGQTVVTGHVGFPDATAPANARNCLIWVNYKHQVPKVIATGTIVAQTNYCIATTPTSGFAIAMHAGGINIATGQPNVVLQNPIGSQTIGGNLAFTGGVTATAGQNAANFYNINDFIYCDGRLYTTINAAVAAAPVGGATVYVTNCPTISSTVAIPKYVKVILSPGTYTASGVTAFDLQGDGAQLIALGGPTLQIGTAGTATVTISCTGLGAGVPCVHGGIPPGSRSTTQATLNAVHGAEIGNLQVNCNGSGGSCFQFVGPYGTNLHDIGIYGANGTGFELDAGLSTDTTTDQIYSLKIDRLQVWTNSTSAKICVLDATYGEIGYSEMSDTRCAGGGSGGGLAKVGLYLKTRTGGRGNSGITMVFTEDYFGGNMASGTGDYGVQLDSNAAAPGAGGVNSLVFNNCTIENFNGGGTASVGIGGVNAGTPNGAGIGNVVFLGTLPNGWSTSIDSPNMGNLALFQGNLNGYPYANNFTGTLNGNGLAGLALTHQWNATAINQTAQGLFNSLNVHDKGFAGQTFYGANFGVGLASGGAGANFGTVAAAKFAAPSFGTNRYAIWTDNVVSTTANPAHSGTVALANTDRITWRDAGNVSDHSMGEFQNVRGVAGCTTAASIGGICATAITVTWPSAFADTNYTAQCWATGVPTNFPSAPYQASKAAGSITVNYFAITAAAASWATIDCTATHD